MHDDSSDLADTIQAIDDGLKALAAAKARLLSVPDTFWKAELSTPARRGPGRPLMRNDRRARSVWAQAVEIRLNEPTLTEREVARRLGISDRHLRRYEREFSGMAEAAITEDLPEVHFQELLHSQMGGRREAPLGFGRADLMTDDVVWEVEPVSRWQHGTRQVLAYAAQCHLRPALAVYGKAKSTEVIRIYRRLRDCPTPVELWWWTGNTWRRVGTGRILV